MARRLNDTEALANTPLGRTPSQVVCETPGDSSVRPLCFTMMPNGVELSPTMERSRQACGNESLSGAMSTLRKGQ